ncbi:MAG: ATP synthase subunit I [Gammaproteobacteria bacterium]|nr:ATP synthase subunit I [Gammaproteobacteria bacterium]
MNYAQAQRTAQQKVTISQMVIVSVSVALFWLAMGWQAGLAVLYGSLIVALTTLLQARQLRRADRIAGLNAGRNLRYLYRCAAERLIATVVLLAVGIGMLRLEPMPLLGGYIIAQVVLVYGWFLESSARRKHG